jgi:hypothetical protein
VTIIANQSGGYLSSVLITDHFLEPDDRDTLNLLDYERGPVALNDPTSGLDYQNWTIRWIPSTGDFTYEAPNTPRTAVHNASNVTELSGSFDQNGNPFITYVESDVAKFWWYDPTIPGDTVSLLPANSLTPRCTHDDKRRIAAEGNLSDIILCYVNAGDLFFRQERDRYEVQYLLQSPLLHPVFELPAVLKRVGMNKKNRLQWLCDLANPLDWCTYKAEVA